MYYIKRITMSGPKVETSSVDLDKGLIFYTVHRILVRVILPNALII